MTEYLGAQASAFRPGLAPALDLLGVGDGYKRRDAVPIVGDIDGVPFGGLTQVYGEVGAQLGGGHGGWLGHVAECTSYETSCTLSVMAIRCRLYPAKAQEGHLVEHCDHARAVWNVAYTQWDNWKPWRKSYAPGPAERQKQLAEARKDIGWLRAGSSSVQQQALRDFDRSVAAFFDPKNPAGRPTWRRKNGSQGFVVRDVRVKRLSRRWGTVFVPKIGAVKFRWTKDLPTKLGSARVTLDKTGRWHVSFPAPQPAIERVKTGSRVGVDRGVRTALVDSTGQHYRAPRISDRDAARYLGLQRKMARQKKGSAGRAKTRLAMAKVAARVADRRKDWVEKVTTRTIIDYDTIVIERLNIAGMTKKPAPKPDPDLPGAFLPNRARAKAGLSEGILSSGWGMYGQRLKAKAEASGVTVVEVDPRYTSQQCRVCGHTEPGNRESQAVFSCKSCGHTDHADRNAACNILARGLLLTTGELVPAPAPGHGVYARHASRKPAQAAAGTSRSAA